jgi:hypothetical protein
MSVYLRIEREDFGWDGIWPAPDLDLGGGWEIVMLRLQTIL